jgi:hypothetical protein
MGKVIQNKLIINCYVCKSMVIIKEALMYQKYQLKIFTLCDQYLSMYHHFSTHDK